jgi:SAM-dependent methyltransferase
MRCPLCCSESRVAFKAKEIPLRDCTVCRHRFAEVAADEEHVARVYDDTYFFGGEAGYSNYTAEGELLIERGKMYAEKLSKYAKPGRVLDVGAACGFLLKGFTERGWTGTGLEPNAGMVRIAREETGVDVVRGSLEGSALDRKFDLVSMIQVAGHFYDPVKAFKRAHEMLNVNGLLLVESWNRESISARLFGRHWHEYSPPSVLQWFSLRGLTGFLAGIGFEQVASGRPSKKIKGSHAKSLLRYRIGDNFLLKLVPDSLNIPYPSEDLFWALYRKGAEDISITGGPGQVDGDMPLETAENYPADIPQDNAERPLHA